MNLHDWATENDMSDRLVAERIGVSRQYVSMLRSGMRTPSAALTARIDEMMRTGIAPPADREGKAR